MNRTKHFPDGKRIVRKALPSEATAWHWLLQQRDEELAEGRDLVRYGVKEGSRGNRHDAYLISVTPNEHVKARHLRKSNRDARQRGKAAEEK